MPPPRPSHRLQRMPARRAWWLGALTIVAACLGLVVACGGGSSSKPHAEIKTNFHAPPEPSLRGIHKIRHVVVIMQENRSFDSYFGTFPGADGIRGSRATPARSRVCRGPRPRCARPTATATGGITSDRDVCGRSTTAWT